MQQFYRLIGNQRRLVGWLGQNRIAGGQGGRDLPRENRQWEVPRADTGEHPRRWRTWRIGPIIAQKINGLAQLCDLIQRCFSSLTGQECKEGTIVFFKQICGFGQYLTTGFGISLPRRGMGQRGFDISVRGAGDLSGRIRWVIRVFDGHGCLWLCCACDQWARRPLRRAKRVSGLIHRSNRWHVAQIHTARVGPFRRK